MERVGALAPRTPPPPRGASFLRQARCRLRLTADKILRVTAFQLTRSFPIVHSDSILNNTQLNRHLSVHYPTLPNIPPNKHILIPTHHTTQHNRNHGNTTPTTLTTCCLRSTRSPALARFVVVMYLTFTPLNTGYGTSFADCDAQEVRGSRPEGHPPRRIHLDRRRRRDPLQDQSKSLKESQNIVFLATN